MDQAIQARVEFTARDVAEIALGTCAIAFPVAVTQEVWDLGVELSMMRAGFIAIMSVLGVELSMMRAGFIAIMSVLGLALVVFLLHHAKTGSIEPKVYFQRLLSTYGIALLVSALLLFAVHRFDPFGAPLIGLKRAILVTFPACFAATGVDSVASPAGSAVGGP